MSNYDEPMQVAEPPDPRVIALHRVIDLERQHASVSRQTEELQKRQAIVRNELSEARDELNAALGLPSNANAMKVSTIAVTTAPRWDA